MHSCHSMSAIVLFSERKIRDRHKREALIEAFRRADKNGDGRLSVDEVRWAKKYRETKFGLQTCVCLQIVAKTNLYILKGGWWLLQLLLFLLLLFLRLLLQLSVLLLLVL